MKCKKIKLYLNKKVKCSLPEIKNKVEITNLKVSTFVSGDYPFYRGEYNVTPKAHTEQTLETRNTILRNNVVVSQVPYYETSNTDGTTVYIASEV